MPEQSLSPEGAHREAHILLELPYALGTTAIEMEVEVPSSFLCDHGAVEAPYVRLQCHNLGDVPTDVGGEGLHKLLTDLGMHPLADQVEAKRQGRLGDRTLVNVDTPVCRLEGEEDEPSEEAAWLARALWALNRIVHTYLIASEDERVHFLSREHISAPVVFSPVPFGHPQFAGTARVLGPPGPIYQFAARELSEEFAKRLEHATGIEPFAHPIDSARLWLLQARRWRYAGEGDQAIVALQTSAERLLYGSFQLVLLDKGIGATELRRRLTSTPFKSLVSKELHGLLGGNWSLADKGPVAVYWQRLYDARNHITHAGYRLHRDHVDEAFDAYEGLEAHLVDRAVAKKNAFPRLAFGLMGSVGLQRRGQLTSRMKAWAEKMEKEDHPFWLPEDHEATAKGEASTGE